MSSLMELFHAAERLKNELRHAYKSNGLQESVAEHSWRLCLMTMVLSETIGACEQLGENALCIAPADLEGTAQALYAALTMPAEERHKRAAALKQSIENRDTTSWLLNVLEDTVKLVEQPVVS